MRTILKQATLIIFTTSSLFAAVGFDDLKLPKLENIPEVKDMQKQIQKSIDGAKDRLKAKKDPEIKTPQKKVITKTKNKGSVGDKKEVKNSNTREPVLFYMKIENGEARLVSSKGTSFKKKEVSEAVSYDQNENNETKAVTIIEKTTTPSLEKQSIKPIISRSEYKELGLDERYFDAYEHMFDSATLLSQGDRYVLNSINDSFQKYIDNLSGDGNINLFFFVDSGMDDDVFLRYSNEVSKLLSENENITARIFVNGLVITKEEKQDLQMQIYKKEKELEKLKEQGKDTVSLEKVIQDLEYKKEGNFDSFYRWAQKLYSIGVRKVKVQFHPQAFKDMELTKVPAYLLSRCDKDFRFQTCKHVALVRGNISLLTFFEMLKEDKKEFGKYYEALLKQAI